jgi:hypothetical protein
MKNIKCVTAREQKGLEKLIEMHNGDEVLARKIWEENGYNVPDEAMALVTEDVQNNSFIVEDVKEVNSTLLAKQKSVRKIKAALTSKLKRLNQLVEKHPGLEKGRAEMEAILDDIDKVSAEETLVSFITAADNMTASVEKWLKAFNEGTKTPTLENLKRMEEYMTSLALVKDFTEDMFENEENKELFKTVDSIVGRYNKLHNGYLSQARKLLSSQLQGNFHKVIRLYEKNAEQLFNKTKKPYIDKADIPQAKAEFINKYMISHATEIELQTHQYIENLLLQTVDVPILAAWIVNPKDMNHDIISIAVESLDKADMDIWTTMETVVDDSEELNEEFVKHIGKHSDPKKQYEILFVKDKEGNVTPKMIGPEDFKQYKEFKDQYSNVPAVWNLYTHLTKLINEKDKMVYTAGRLGYKLPMLEQGDLERLYSNGLISFVKEGILDRFKLRGKDVDMGLLSDDMLTNSKIEKAKNVEEVYITEAGEERATIPLYYRNHKVEEKVISYDIMKSIVLDYHNSLKFKTKTESAVFLDVLKDVMHDADIIQTTSFVQKLKINKETKDLHTSKKGTSNITDTLEGLIRHRVYGIKIEGDPKANKIYQTLGKYTSFLTMSANVLSGSANLLHGTTMSWIEALGGNTGYFTPKDKIKAVKQYNSSIGALLSDVGERAPKAKINLAIRKFNAMSESHLLNGKDYTQNNKFKRIAETSALMMPNAVGEHAMQSIVMLSTLNNIKVKDVNGNFLDADFKPTTDRSQAIGVYDALLQDGSKLEFHPSVNSTERTKTVDADAIFKISAMIRRINRDLYGNYDSENKARYQRTGAGALMAQMRGFLIPGMQKRFRGAGTSNLFSKDFLKVGEEFTFENLHKLSYNTEIQEFEEGQYITTARFLRTAVTEVKALKSIAGTKEAWNNMDDQQKANVRKTMIELAVALGFLLLSKMFDDDPEDPNDVENMYAAYVTRRMYSELFTYINPHETIRTFRSPMIALSSIESAIKAGGQLFTDPTEVYDGGRHSGEYKLWRAIKKLIPVYKQIDRNIEDSYLYLKS